MPSAIIVGGGLAGLSAAIALAESGFQVDVFESRPYPGGRATSYDVPGSDGSLRTVDNCQHILLKCCHNLLDLYRRLGVSGAIDFHSQFYFVEPGGRISRLQAGLLPAPAHFLKSFAGVEFLTMNEKYALTLGLGALFRERSRRTDLHEITMAEWLLAHHQPPRVIERFWRQVLVSAVNEELDRMAAAYGFQVIAQTFFGDPEGYIMGVPAVPLGELYNGKSWVRYPTVRFRFRSQVVSLDGKCILAGGEAFEADYYVAAVPGDRATVMIDGLDIPEYEHSPITGVHLWFDRSVTDLPHATLLDRTIQWMFNKGGGQHLHLVVSASRSLMPLDRRQIIELCLRELAEFVPQVSSARLLRAHVVKELKATFSACVGFEPTRPGARTRRPNLFLAGDWTNTGWPSTMEGAVRSGYLAAEAVTEAAGSPRHFLLPS